MRDANPHIPSSDKNQKVNINARCDRGKIKNRIREKALRNEPLDRSNAKDLVQVVRILREVDVVSAFSSSTTRIRDRTQLLGRKTEDKKNLTV